MIKTRGLITKVQPYKDNHLMINIYSQDYGKKSLIVFGGKSKKKRSSITVGSINNFEFNMKDNVCKLSEVQLSHNWFLYNKYQLKLNLDKSVLLKKISLVYSLIQKSLHYFL